MKNTERTIYSLCCAMGFCLSASILAEDAVSNETDASEKILLMESIHVTAMKEISEDDVGSGDPDVDQILRLVDSLQEEPSSETTREANAETESNESKFDLDVKNSQHSEENLEQESATVPDAAKLKLVDSLSSSKTTTD